MRRLPNSILLFLLIMVFLVFLPTLIHAQPYDACAGMPDPGCDPADTSPACICPIDGGLSALIALGLGYGIKKVKDGRKSLSTKQVS